MNQQPQVLKYKPLGEMAQRSRAWGGAYVKLQDFDHQTNLLVEAQDYAEKLQAELARIKKLDPLKWTDRQILDFLGVALRNVDLVGEVRLSEIRQAFEYMQSVLPAKEAPPCSS